MNGKEQATALAKLAGYKPDQLGGFRIGDHVTLPGISAYLAVIDLLPPDELALQSAAGVQLRARYRACRRVRTVDDMEDSK